MFFFITVKIYKHALIGLNPQINGRTCTVTIPLVVVEANANATYAGGVESLDIQPPEGKEVGAVFGSVAERCRSTSSTSG